MNWEIILWCSFTIAFFLFVFLGFYFISSARMMKKRRGSLIELLDALKPGKSVICAGGLKGTIKKVGEEFMDVEIAKGITITVSNLSVSQIIEKK